MNKTLHDLNKDELKCLISTIRNETIKEVLESKIHFAVFISDQQIRQALDYECCFINMIDARNYINDLEIDNDDFYITEDDLANGENFFETTDGAWFIFSLPITSHFRLSPHDIAKLKMKKNKRLISSIGDSQHI